MTTEMQSAQPPLPPAEVILRLRKRVEQGEKLTRDEVRLGLDAIRRDRQAATPAKKSAAKGPTRSAEELMALLTKSVGGTQSVGGTKS